MDSKLCTDGLEAELVMFLERLSLLVSVWWATVLQCDGMQSFHPWFCLREDPREGVSH